MRPRTWQRVLGNDLLQVALSGSRPEVLAGRDIFLQAGADDYVPLRVSGAFHSRHMAPAAAGFAAYLAEVPLDSPRIPVISNVTAAPYGEPPAGLLVRQLTSCVRWTASIEYLIAADVGTIEQVGPGKAIGKLVRAIRQDRASREDDGAVIADHTSEKAGRA